jgi:hypothetical protein
VHFSWDYTTYLNVVFLALLVVLYCVYRNRARLGADAGYALDPVCGMQVEVASAPACAVHDGKVFYFCSDRCRSRFEADPARFSAKAGRPEGAATRPAHR